MSRYELFTVYDGTTPKTLLVDDYAGNIVTYTVGDDGVYKLSIDTGVYDPKGVGTYSFTNGKSVMEIDGTPYYTTSETIFVVCTYKNATTKNYNVYTGYAAAPSLIAGNLQGVAFVCNDDYTSQLDIVYIAATSMGGIEDVDAYFVKKTNAEIITNSDGSYYVLPAIMDEKETTIKIDAKYLDTKLTALNASYTNANTKGMYAIKNVAKDSHDIITSFDWATPFNASDAGGGTTSVTGTVAANGVVLGIGGTKTTAVFWAYDKDTNVYVVDEDYKTITISDVESVATDATDKVYAGRTTNTKVLTDVIIVEQPENTPSNKTTATFKVKGIDVVDGKVLLTDTAAKNTTGGDPNAVVLTPTLATGAEIIEAEYSTDDGTTWTDWGLTSYKTSVNVSSWADGMTLRITVEAADGVTKQVYTIKVNYAYTVTFATANTPAASNTAIFTVGDKVYKAGDKLDVLKDETLTFKVTAADNHTLSTVKQGITTLVGYSGVYNCTISADCTIEATTTTNP